MSQLNDAKFAALRAQGFVGANPDMTLQWLQSLGATSNALADAWNQMLDQFPVLGPAGSSTSDRWHRLLELAGYFGHINDAELLFWTEGAAILLPTAVYNNFTIDSQGNALGSPINAWNDTRDNTEVFDFDDNSGAPSVSLGSINNLRAINFDGSGYIGPTVALDLGEGYEGFFVIVNPPGAPLQIIRAPHTAAIGATFQVAIENGNLVTRISTLNDGNWDFQITIPDLSNGLNVIYYRVDSGNSALHVLDFAGERSETGLFPVLGSSYIRLGSSEDGDGFSGQIGEFWAYELTNLPNERITAIMASLYEKWRSRPQIWYNQNTHDFTGPGDSFVAWNTVDGRPGARLIPATPINITDYEEVLVNGLLAVRRVGGPGLRNTISSFYNDNNYTIFFVFQNDQPDTGERFVLDGGLGSSGSGGRVNVAANESDLAYDVRPRGGTVGPIPQGPVGVQDLLPHLITIERRSGQALTVRWDGQDVYNVESMPNPPLIYRPLSLFSTYNNLLHFEGIVCEYVFFTPRIAFVPARNGLEQQLMAKWGIIPSNTVVVNFTMDVGDAVQWIGYDTIEGTGDFEPKDIPTFPQPMANFRSNRTNDVSTLAFGGTRNQDVDDIAISFDGGPSIVMAWNAGQSRYDLGGSVAMRDFLLANLGEQVTGTLTYEI